MCIRDSRKGLSNCSYRKNTFTTYLHCTISDEKRNIKKIDSVFNSVKSCFPLCERLKNILNVLKNIKDRRDTI